MPILTLRTNQLLTEDTMSRLAGGLSSITENVLRKNPEVIVVRFVSDESPDCWYVNSTPKKSDAIIFELDIVITTGTNSQQEKAEWIKQSWKKICDVLGENSDPNYISVKELNGNNWGYNGLTQNLRKINHSLTKEAKNDYSERV